MLLLPELWLRCMFSLSLPLNWSSCSHSGMFDLSEPYVWTYLRQFGEGRARELFSAVVSWLFTCREFTVCPPPARGRERGRQRLWSGLTGAAELLSPLLVLKNGERNVFRSSSILAEKWLVLHEQMSPLLTASSRNLHWAPWHLSLSLCAQALCSVLIKWQNNSCRPSLFPVV